MCDRMFIISNILKGFLKISFAIANLIALPKMSIIQTVKRIFDVYTCLFTFKKRRKLISN